MTEKGFIPLSGELGIAGTSYRLQLGLINNKWASRILKGRDILDSYVYKDSELTADKEYPNQNYVVGWVLRTVMLPNINPHQIMKTTQALIKQAIQRKQQKKVVAPVAETKRVELETVPESEIKRPSSGPGWVKQEGEKTQEEKLEEQRRAFKERIAAERAKEAQASGASTIKTRRQLPTIPGATPQTTHEEATQAPPSAAAPEISTPESTSEGATKFCPYCGKPLATHCPFCGRRLPPD
ncbi:MAG: zinc ribbon domain-containing protein [Promethearchaeota archaeon]